MRRDQQGPFRAGAEGRDDVSLTARLRSPVRAYSAAADSEAAQPPFPDLRCALSATLRGGSVESRHERHLIALRAGRERRTDWIAGRDRLEKRGRTFHRNRGEPRRIARVLPHEKSRNRKHASQRCAQLAERAAVSRVLSGGSRLGIQPGESAPRGLGKSTVDPDPFGPTADLACRQI